MVGIDKIREYLGDFNANYVIIGGTARNLHLEEAGLQGRVTKDIDMIVVCEAISPEYLRQFWAFIKAGGYTPERVDTEDGDKWSYYRFKKRTDPAFPEYIELFSRTPDGIRVPEDVHIVPVKMDDEYLSSFSAILMDDDYYRYALDHSREIEGVQVLDTDGLVVLKAKAYLNNKKLKDEGKDIQQDKIDKHKNDIYRISFLFSGEERYKVSEGIKVDLMAFLTEIEIDPISTKALAKAVGVAEVPMTDFVQLIKTIFQL
jgi:hypothetical protein